MQNHKWLVVLMVAVLSPIARAEFSLKEICVQTFNLYGPVYAPFVKTRTRLALQHLKARAQKCDSLHFQEVWTAEHLQYFKQQAVQYIEQPSIIAADEDRSDSYSTGLVSIHTKPTEAVESARFTSNESGPTDWLRSALGVAKGYLITSVDGVVYINSHLHHWDAGVRLAQLVQLSKVLETDAYRDQPILWMGDFNFEEGSIEYKFVTTVLGFKDGYRQLNQGDGCTHCVSNFLSLSLKNRRIDYVFFRDGREIELLPLKAEILYTPDDLGFSISDHYGLEVSFQPRRRATCLAHLTQDRWGASNHLLSQVLKGLANVKNASRHRGWLESRMKAAKS